MPGYGIDEGGVLLRWSWTLERLATSHEYWLATSWPGHSPHVLPVWAVWHEEALWFSTGGSSRKARNLAAEPSATLTTENPREPVVVEGRVERVEDRERIASFVHAYEAKYGSAGGIEFFLANACFRLVPTMAFGMVETDFTGSPTRWTF
ncbi:MAG: pyridoxamine 5-phosphate oxidase-related FMN-binding protein [Acidimicrobiales bacterium]|nr:pyridoxamine 5-phosphate oxidase-related FMN-binding protein [Acidimicrobiales bacterium]